MKTLRILCFLGIVACCARPAYATRAYFDGTFKSNGTLCPVTGNAVTVLQSNTGYFTDPGEPYPRTGDLAYVRAFGGNVSPCVDDAVGFEFFPPDGASLAISVTNPVYCIRGKIDGTFSEYFGNSGNSSCSQTPSIGVNGGYYFGYSAIPPGWYVEIRVPLVFNKKLLGIAGPASHKLTVATLSAYGTVFPDQPVTVFYRAILDNPASSGITSSSANLAFTLTSYFNSGLLYIDYGTTAAFGSSTPAAGIPNTALSFPINGALSALSASTTYFWRGRFVTSDGTFTTTTQSFTTSPIVVSPPGTPAIGAPANGATGVSTSAALSWSSTGATSYTVKFGTTNPPPQVATGLGSASYSPAGMLASTLYYWQIVATNSGGSTPGPVWSFTTQAAVSPPGTPTVVSPASGATGVSTSASLSWSSTGATSYAVKFGTANPPGQVATGLASASYTPAGMVASTLYYWQIVATNTGGSTPGPVWSFTTQAGGSAPAITTQPPHRKITPGQTASISVLASGTPTLTYQWYVGTSGSTGSPVGGATSSSYTTPALSSSTSYWVRVSNGLGSADSATAYITVAAAGARRVPNDFNHDGLSDIGVFRPSLGRFVIPGQPVITWGLTGDIPVAGDFNNDGHPDIAVFRPSNGTWYIKDVAAPIVWGIPGDIPVPGDYYGDGMIDIAVFRPSTGTFYIRDGDTIPWGAAGDLPVVGDYNGDRIDDIAVYRPSTGTWYIRNVATVTFGFAADIPAPADFNGDGTTEIAVFRPSNGTWYLNGGATFAWGQGGDVPVPLDRNSDGQPELGVFRRATGTWHFKNRSTGASESVLWGAPGDIPLGTAVLPAVAGAGDFDGDRKADLTVFRPSTGDWVSLRSLTGFTDYTIRTFGLSADTPVARDYDGDGKIDPAVYRPSTGRWYMLQSSTNFTSYTLQDWGITGDLPVPGDYDGDGKADVAVFRPSLARWVILLSSTGNASYAAYDFGLSTDIPVPADYDGDGQIDIAVFRPSTGRWYVYNRAAGTYQVFDWGLTGDVPVPADFDGDGKADLAVFRPSLGRWVIKSSADGSYSTADWGLSGDALVPGDFNGDGKADVAVFRPSTGMWYVRGLFNRSWGLAGDQAGIKIP